ncbi:MAG: Na+/H+ antiporter NhaC family protein, partial [Dethiobacteria bacterium]
MIIFFCDYTSSLITGNTARPLTDRLRISREKLAYIVDSTAAPVATMALISTWIGYELGIIGEAFAKIGVEASPYSIFLQSIPYRFYSIFALSLVVIIAVTLRDFGPMYDAEIRTRTTGKVLRDGAVPLAAGDIEEMMPKEGIPYRAVNFIVPIAFLIISTFIGLYWHGVNVGGADPGNILEAIGASDSVLVLIWTSLLSAIVTMIMILVQKLLTFQEAFDTFMAGAKSVFAALVILVFAWALSAVTGELGADSYLVGLVTAAKVPYQLLPLIIFLISCLMAFAMGTSWGTMGIVTPLAIPVAHAVAPHILIPTLASVLTGAIFGDHCSPISDTTILSSTGSGSDHIDHVRTQMPYALLGAAVSAVFGFIPAGFGVPVWISIILGIGALIVFVRFVGKSTH